MTSTNLYIPREKIIVRSVDGFYQRLRVFTVLPLLAGYFLTPWLLIEGRQAILFDLGTRQFHIFWWTFWPQDFVLLAWGLMVGAFLLFFVTSLFGRVWCGYTCPQTVWTHLFMWAERIAEGERHRRLRLENAHWTLNKVVRRLVKHVLWLAIAGATGITFVAYFYDMRTLIADAAGLQLPAVAAVWIAIFTAATYVNAGWMREQVCTYMCPYARFQSAMFDADTFTVAYDDRRGEPRGSKRDEAGGDCVDCTLCVQVCPVGIDIRDGLQYQCIDCALCIDACDAVMETVNRPTGLIRYTTLNLLAGQGWTVKRLKTIGYGVALTVMVIAISVAMSTRAFIDLEVQRTRGELYQPLSDGSIQNIYLLKVLNKDQVDHEYELQITGIRDAELRPDTTIRVSAGSAVEISRQVVVPEDVLRAPISNITFHVTTRNDVHQASADSRFFGPTGTSQ